MTTTFTDAEHACRDGLALQVQPVAPTRRAARLFSDLIRRNVAPDALTASEEQGLRDYVYHVVETKKTRLRAALREGDLVQAAKIAEDITRQRSVRLWATYQRWKDIDLGERLGLLDDIDPYAPPHSIRWKVRSKRSGGFRRTVAPSKIDRARQDVMRVALTGSAVDVPTISWKQASEEFAVAMQAAPTTAHCATLDVTDHHGTGTLMTQVNAPRKMRRSLGALVHEAFLGPVPEGFRVKPKDGDATKTAPSNLTLTPGSRASAPPAPRRVHEPWPIELDHSEEWMRSRLENGFYPTDAKGRPTATARHLAAQFDRIVSECDAIGVPHENFSRFRAVPAFLGILYRTNARTLRPFEEGAPGHHHERLRVALKSPADGMTPDNLALVVDGVAVIRKPRYAR